MDKKQTYVIYYCVTGQLNSFTVKSERDLCTDFHMSKQSQHDKYLVWEDGCFDADYIQGVVRIG